MVNLVGNIQEFIMMHFLLMIKIYSIVKFQDKEIN